MQVPMFAPGIRIEMVALLDDPDSSPQRTSGTVIVEERIGTPVGPSKSIGTTAGRLAWRSPRIESGR